MRNAATIGLALVGAITGVVALCTRGATPADAPTPWATAPPTATAVPFVVKPLDGKVWEGWEAPNGGVILCQRYASMTACVLVPPTAIAASATLLPPSPTPAGPTPVAP